ncbi:MAG: Hpt domain-containing protein [Deltaproteobacteria bacterium]|nr:Hpt domain-containing protein [Deltaproteobacteria bacterium]
MVDKWAAGVDRFQWTKDVLEKKIPDVRCREASSRETGIPHSHGAEATDPYPSPTESPPMDSNRAVEEFEGDEGFLMEVLYGFIETVNSQTEIIRKALSERNAETVREEAHSIKGGAANLTANALSAIALELENAGKSGGLEKGIDILEGFEKELDRLKAFVRARAGADEMNEWESGRVEEFKIGIP